MTAHASSPDDAITVETSPCDSDLPTGDGIRIPKKKLNISIKTPNNKYKSKKGTKMKLISYSKTVASYELVISDDVEVHSLDCKLPHRTTNITENLCIQAVKAMKRKYRRILLPKMTGNQYKEREVISKSTQQHYRQNTHI